MTTQTKHDGWWCAFRPDGRPMAVTNARNREMAEWVAGREHSRPAELAEEAWVRISAQGYTVRPVTITEVKDDE